MGIFNALLIFESQILSCKQDTVEIVCFLNKARAFLLFTYVLKLL